MRKSLQTISTAQRLSNRIFPMLALYLLVPCVVLAAFGAYAIFDQGWWLWFIAALASCTLLFSIPLLLRRKTKQPLAAIGLQTTAQKLPSYWTEFDQQQYHNILPLALDLLGEDASWSSLPNHGLRIMQITAQHYSAKNYAEWSFSLTEFLKVLENISQRYRQVLKENVPGIEHAKISTILRANDQLQKYKFLQRFYNVYRKARIITPTGLIAEMRSMIFDQAFDGVSDELLHKIKCLLVEEALQVAIDLYGGHFNFSDDELVLSKAAQQDAKRMALEPEPLRIGIIGQVSAGKSSLVNYLIGYFHAETDSLPCTEQAHVYKLTLAEQQIHLLDLPGLDQAPKQQATSLAQLQECDLILWVLKANQPARELDKQTLDLLRAWYAQDKQRSRKMPIIVGVLSQVDKLVKPLPEDLQQTDGIIAQAVAYNQQLLGLDAIVPVAISQQQLINQAALFAEIQRQSAAALNVQLNRRRHDSHQINFKQQFARCLTFIKTLYQLSNKN